MLMRFDTISSVIPPESIHVQCAALKKSLRECSAEMIKIFIDDQSENSGSVKPHEEE